MTMLREILKSAKVCKALIIDDAYDAVPLASDLSIELDEWTQVFDDMSEKDKSTLRNIFPAYESTRADTLRDMNDFVGLLWGSRDKISKEVFDPLFSRYDTDKANDLRKLGNLDKQLKDLGLECDTSGRAFKEKASSADIIFIDLYLSSSQASEDIRASIDGLSEVISKRKATPPLVVLMSNSTRLPGKREEFRDSAGLFESNFRILGKADIADQTILRRLLTRLAIHYGDSLKLASFVHAWQTGLDNAKERTSRLIRKLSLSDLAQIHQLLLSVEGEPTGTYLVDVFDKVLQHEIEREDSIITAAISLNSLTSEAYPPPHVPGSKDLQDLVQRTLFQNRMRLMLPGAIGSRIAFGDILRRRAVPADIAGGETAQKALLEDVGDKDILAVLSPACDLQRKEAKRVLLLVGTLQPFTPSDWKHKDDSARTPVIEMANGERFWVRWIVKHIETLSHAEIDSLLSGEQPPFEIIARLRESHALELQQKLLSSLGRIGITAPMPATFHMTVEAYLPDASKKPFRLDIPALNDGGVCFIGRPDDDGKPQERLILAEDACEAICQAIGSVDLGAVHPAAHEIIKYLRNSDDLLQALEKGVSLPGARNQGYKDIEAQNGKVIGLVNRFKINIDTVLINNKILPKSGIILSVFDQESFMPPEADVEEPLIQPAAE